MNSSGKARPDVGATLLDLYDEALPEVYGYPLARCGSRALAEDLTAETFLAAVAAARRHPLPVPSVGWLIGIARHKLVDHWRAVEREERGLRAVDTGPEPADDPWDERLDALLARQVLEGQTGVHRAVLTLRYLDGLPVREVARVLGRTVHATEALLVRARAAGRRCRYGPGSHLEQSSVILFPGSGGAIQDRNERHATVVATALACSSGRSHAVDRGESRMRVGAAAVRFGSDRSRA